ncbi:coiled-coil domain-containing protein 138-like [Ostrea edulis]|uniref:coiled-coil domain-containing protein 138-like n=1 Tax=Ostrea edulis TaxID=37623 RepID=UPI002095CE5C|nr:coiled-coil domain-containing protein 138-like [Ostrea edulis]
MSKSRPKPLKGDLSGESDLDSTITPINAATDNSQGRIIESDSLSDFYLHEISGKHRRKKQHHHKTKAALDSDEEEYHNISNENIRDIYKELRVISEKLKLENKSLHEREQKLKERERMVSISSQNIQTIAQHEIKQKLQAVEERYKADIYRLETLLREKCKENKRLKDNFETLKQANDALKKEFECLQSQHEKLEKQAVTVQARLTNLQRKQEFDQRQKELDVAAVAMGNAVPKQQKPKEAEEKTKQRTQKTAACCFDVTGILLDWVSDAHLRCAVSDLPGKPLERFLSPEYLQEKIMKILPSAVDMLREFPGQNLKISLPCIQFIYWALTHVENCAGQQKSGLSSTLRRLGEELYRAKTVRFSELEKTPSEFNPPSPIKLDKSKDGIYFRSQNLHVRLLSSFIILKTLSQVDLLAHVFDVLRNDLKSDIAKELFLYYQATPVVLQYLKPVNKTFMGSAMDIFLQMSTDSPFLQPFLETCSNENWFRTVAMVLRAPSQDSKLLEKLSIILQKLSKFRCNRKYFDVYTIVGIIQELLRGCPTDQAFLGLNLKSILFNLTSGAAQ